MKGYNTSNGYMGYVEGKYILFASEQEYFEFMPLQGLYLCYTWVGIKGFRIISGNPRQFNYRDESANCAYLHS